MSTQQRPETRAKPVVMIVGAGIGGLMLALLLERLGLSYRVYERAPEVKPLGNVVNRIGFKYNNSPFGSSFPQKRRTRLFCHNSLHPSNDV